MRKIAIIPARSNSKGLQDKNMAFFDGRPLSTYSIQSALESGFFSEKDIYYSTDSKEYIDNLKQYYPNVNYVLRDENLASDISTTRDFLLDFLNIIPEDDVEFVLLQPTSPLRTGKNIIEAFINFSELDCHAVVSLKKAPASKILYTELGKNNQLSDIIGVDKNYRRQSSNDQYVPNGAIYLTTKRKYLIEESFFTEKTFGYIMHEKESIDIDDYFDFYTAVGHNFFDYTKREKKNYENNKFELVGKLKSFDEKKSDGIIIGDSRLVNYHHHKFLNISISGITAKTVNEIFHEHNICINPKKVIIGLGVNDINIEKELSKIVKNIKEIAESFPNSKIIYTEIFPIIYRPGLSNQKIKEVNNIVQNKFNTDFHSILSYPEELVSLGKLNFNFTNDGLHLNPKGEKIYFDNITKNIDEGL